MLYVILETLSQYIVRTCYIGAIYPSAVVLYLTQILHV